MAMHDMTPSSGAAGPATIADTVVAVYSFPRGAPMDVVLVQNDPGSGVNLRIKWNDTACAPATGWDAVLEAGDFASSPPGVIINKVAIRCEGAAGVTYPDDFTVRGWPFGGASALH